MKSKNLLLALVAVSMTAFFSCVSDELQDSSNVDIHRVVAQLPPFLDENTGTRTQINVDASGQINYTWAVGDVLGIFPDKGIQTFFELDASSLSADGQTATFDGGGWALKGGRPYYAYYPFDEKYCNRASSPSAIGVSYLGQKTTAWGDTRSAAQRDFNASPGAQSQGGVLSFNFVRLGALLRLKMTLPATASYQTLTLATDADVIPVAGTVDLTSASLAYTPTTYAKSISVDLANVQGTKGESVYIYVMLPAMTLRTQGKTLTATLSYDYGTTKTYNLCKTGQTTPHTPDLLADYIYNRDLVSPTSDPVENDPDEPTNTGDATDITSFSATISAFFNADQDNVTEIGILYATDDIVNKTTATKKTVSKSSIGADAKYSVKLTGLSDNTTYYYRSYYISGGIWFYGKVLSFTTLPQNVGVTFETSDATNVAITSATISAKLLISESSVYQNLEYGFYWGTDPEPATKQKITSRDTDGNYQFVLKKLDENKTYYYRPYAILDGTAFYGTTKSFVTLPASTAFETGGATNVTCYSAKVHAKLMIPSGSVYSSLEYGIYWGNTPEPTTKIKVTSKDAQGNYTATLTGLYGSTQYYYRPYIILDGVTYYGPTSSFNTQEDNVVTTGTINTDTYTVTSTLHIGNGSFSNLVLGVCWSPNATPTIDNYKVTTNEVDEDYNFTLTLNMTLEGMVYYRAYVLIDGAPHYGVTKSFESQFQYAYVDLGLPSHLKWATCNVGASTPEEYGDYFAWGETVGYLGGKTTFNRSTYKWYNGSYYTLTKYCTDSPYGTYGTVDNKKVLESADDAATQSWGGAWRMPTQAEWKELVDNTSNKWTSRSTASGTVYGYEFTGNGQTLFLPAAGYRYGALIDNAGSVGYYWSSSLNESYPDLAWLLYFYSGNIRADFDYSRFFDHSVRPVCP